MRYVNRWNPADRDFTRQRQGLFPARVQLIAAMNPSPTGHYQELHNRTSPQQVLRYLARLSGPFLDRFDLSIEVPLLPPGTLSQRKTQGESSELVRKRVQQARARQLERAGSQRAVEQPRSGT